MPVQTPNLSKEKLIEILNAIPNYKIVEALCSRNKKLSFEEIKALSDHSGFTLSQKDKQGDVRDQASQTENNITRIAGKPGKSDLGGHKYGVSAISLPIFPRRVWKSK